MMQNLKAYLVGVLKAAWMEIKMVAAHPMLVLRTALRVLFIGPALLLFFATALDYVGGFEQKALNEVHSEAKLQRALVGTLPNGAIRVCAQTDLPGLADKAAVDLDICQASAVRKIADVAKERAENYRASYGIMVTLSLILLCIFNVFGALYSGAIPALVYRLFLRPLETGAVAKVGLAPLVAALTNAPGFSDCFCDAMSAQALTQRLREHGHPLPRHPGRTSTPQINPTPNSD
jgi:hypothetical protein